jgi:hypothetical protein
MCFHELVNFCNSLSVTFDFRPLGPFTLDSRLEWTDPLPAPAVYTMRFSSCKDHSVVGWAQIEIVPTKSQASANRMFGDYVE